ncbi:carotenoid oxygenase [Chytriomyces sp. MP71]|nr:carotenoid oxygenase [Chytriomyces sp. MP71]
MDKTTHPDDPEWNFIAAFENGQEVPEPINCTVSGSLPFWLSGKLYRTGPAIYDTLDSKRKVTLEHWFDGIGITHKFEIHNDQKVTYRNCITGKQRLKSIGERGLKGARTFGPANDPCKTLFEKVSSFFSDGGHEDNVNVSVSPHFVVPGSKEPLLVLKTDANLLQVLDPETLEPVKGGIQNYGLLNELSNAPLSLAHEELDPVKNTFMNVVAAPGPKPEFIVFEQSQLPGAGPAEILAKFHDPDMYYQHSFISTTKYVVVPLWPIMYAWRGAKILTSSSLTDAMEWNPHKLTRFIVIDRALKKVVTEYQGPAEFCFHTVNAFDDENGDIVMDFIMYQSGEVVRKFMLADVRSSSADSKSVAELRELTETRFKRMKLGAVKEAIAAYIPGRVLATDAPVAGVVFDNPISMELPRINPTWKHRPDYRYTYGVGATQREKHSHVIFDSLVKFDARTQTHAIWSKVGFSPSEPIFVARPGGTEEDDGVVISVVLDGMLRRSFLLVLDARTMQEVGRADVGIALPYGLHGSFVSNLL